MIKILIPILFLLISCSDKKSETEKNTTEFNINWTEFNTKDSIPKLLTLTLTKVFKEDFKIANPNEDFNRTDVIINDSLPTRHLRLLSQKNSLWRITYVQGGFGKHYVYAECKILKDSIFDFKNTQTILKLENNDSINKYLSNKQLELKKVKITMK